jgi:hypothetical protein
MCRGPARSRGRGASNRPSSMHVDDFERQKAGGGGPPATAASATSLQSSHGHGCKQPRSLLCTASAGCPEHLPVTVPFCMTLHRSASLYMAGRPSSGFCCGRRSRDEGGVKEERVEASKKVGCCFKQFSALLNPLHAGRSVLPPAAHFSFSLCVPVPVSHLLSTVRFWQSAHSAASSAAPVRDDTL